MAGNFIVFRAFIYIPGALILSAQNNANENNLYTAHNNAFTNGIAGHQHTGIAGDGGWPLGPASLDLAAAYPWTGSHTWGGPGISAFNNGLTINGGATINGGGTWNGSPTLVTPFIANFTNAQHNHTSAATGGPIGGVVAGVVPIGAIIPWYDFGLLALDPSYAYCNGAAVAVSGIGVQTLPDLSGRYLVGFGTDGGGNIGTVPFVAGAVGNAGSTINIQHTHTQNAHTHSVTASGTTDAGGAVSSGGPSTDSTDTSGGSNTGNESSHTHGVGSLQMRTFEVTTTDTGGGGVLFSGLSYFGPTGTAHTVDARANPGAGATTTYGVPPSGVYADYPSPGGGGSVTAYFYTSGGTGSTAAGSAHNHTTPNHAHTLSAHTHTGGSHTHTFTSGAATTGTQSDTGMSSSLSTTQDIRPRSIPVRFIMRVA